MRRSAGDDVKLSGLFFAAGVADVAVRFGVGATRLLDKKYNGAEY